MHRGADGPVLDAQVRGVVTLDTLLLRGPHMPVIESLAYLTTLVIAML